MFRQRGPHPSPNRSPTAIFAASSVAPLFKSQNQFWNAGFIKHSIVGRGSSRTVFNLAGCITLPPSPYNPLFIVLPHHATLPTIEQIALMHIDKVDPENKWAWDTEVYGYWRRGEHICWPFGIGWLELASSEGGAICVTIFDAAANTIC